MKPNQQRQAAAAQSRQMSMRDADAETIAKYTRTRGAPAASTQASHRRPPSAGPSVFSSRPGSSTPRQKVSLADVFPDDPDNDPAPPTAHSRAQKPACPPSIFGGAPAAGKAPAAHGSRMLGVPFPDATAASGSGPPSRGSCGSLTFGASFPSMQPMHAALPLGGGGARAPPHAPLGLHNGRQQPTSFQAAFAAPAAGARSGGRPGGGSSFVFG